MNAKYQENIKKQPRVNQYLEKNSKEKMVLDRIGFRCWYGFLPFTPFHEIP